MSDLKSICGYCCEDILDQKESVAINLICLHSNCLPFFRKRQKALQIQAFQKGKVFTLPVLTASQAALIEEISKHFDCHPLLVERIAYQRKWDKKKIMDQVPGYIEYVRKSKKVTRNSVKNYLNAAFHYQPDGAHGYDHDGNQVLYHLMGRFPTGLTAEETHSWMDLLGEAYHASPASAKKGMCLVFSFENFSKSNMDFAVGQEYLKTLQSVIPVRVAKLVVYKPSPLFGAFFAVLRKFFSAKLRQRIHIVDDLRELIPIEHVPVECGGPVKIDWLKTTDDFFSLAERSWKMTEK